MFLALRGVRVTPHGGRWVQRDKQSLETEFAEHVEKLRDARR